MPLPSTIYVTGYLGDDTGPSKEMRLHTLCAIKRSRVLLVPKTDTIVIWSSTQVEDNTQVIVITSMELRGIRKDPSL